jgi:Tat protein secretion system quality control protein TatD with DNase activity
MFGHLAGADQCPVPPGAFRLLQERWFEEQVKLAKELRRPLFMHCRDAADKFADILRCGGDRCAALCVGEMAGQDVPDVLQRDVDS